MVLKKDNPSIPLAQGIEETINGMDIAIVCPDSMKKIKNASLVKGLVLSVLL